MDTASRPRLLLKSLHRIMAGKGSSQGKLDRVVAEIAKQMDAAVCSVFLLNPNGLLELYATQGLKPGAVHKSVLPIGQGLVGHVAKTGLPLNVAEAAQHPKFVYLPETGEEVFRSFTAVPVIRHLEVAGVLVVQGRELKAQGEAEVETLQTVAMVLAEMIAGGELRGLAEPARPARTGQAAVEGQKLAEGLALGAAVFHEPKVEVTDIVSDDVEKETARLATAFEQLRQQLDLLLQAPDLNLFGDHQEILETYKMFTYDRGWQRRIAAAAETGLTAEAATEKVLQEMRAHYIRMNDPYLADRLGDLEDLSNRLIRILMGFVGEKAHRKLTADSILVARSIGPAELLDYGRAYLKGVLLEEGTPTSHATVVARGLGIPMLGQAAGVLGRVEEGDRIILDAEQGRAYIRPAAEAAKAFQAARAEHDKLRKLYAAERALPAVTKDGVKVTLAMNAALLMDLEHLDATGAEGIGLFRTEFPFMVSATLPRMAAQTALYEKVLAAAGDRPVVFRTLDIGGDKRVPFIAHEEEENPALGLRAIRLALERPGLLRYQVRALMLAAAGRDLKLMFPMVAEVGEVLEARELVTREIARARKGGQTPPRSIAIGAMLEVPALAWQLDSLLKAVDFVSIGSNDLMQFFFAADRSNPRLSGRYDILSPAALSMLRSVAAACEKVKMPLTLCGEMGGRPLEALALLGIGIASLSLSPSSIGPVKRLVRSVEAKPLRDWLLPKLSGPAHSLRGALLDYARERKLPV